MSLIDSEDFDSSGSLPAGWAGTSAAIWLVVGASGGVTPTSSPHMLELGDSNGAQLDFFVWQTADGNGGDVVAEADVNCLSSSAGVFFGGVFCRGSSSTMSGSPSAYVGYWIASTSTFAIALISAGVLGSPLASLAAASAPSGWPRLALTANGSSLELAVQDVGTGDYLQPGGTWSATSATAVAATDGTLSGAGYYGCFGGSASGSFVGFFDTLSLSTAGSSPPVVTPNPPVVVAIPFGWLPANMF